MARSGVVPLRIALTGRTARSETVFVQPSAYLLSIITTLPDPAAAVELHSSYVGHPGSATHATHLLVGPLAGQQATERSTHDEREVCLVFTPRNAVYDHAHRLVKFLRDLGLSPSVEVPDEAFVELEAITR